MTTYVSRLMGLIVVALVSFLFVIQWGATDLTSGDVLACLVGQCQSNMAESVLWQIRIPRALLGFLVGAGLACSGAVLQNVTRNPLADPYLFGIVAGAGLGVVIAHLFLPDLSIHLLPLAAFVGAITAIIMVLALARYLFRVELILLAGVAIAFMLGASTQFLLYMGEPLASNRIMFWLMGSLAGAEMTQVMVLVPVLLLSFVMALMVHRQLDAMLLDDDTAKTLGVNVTRMRALLLLGCALVTATIVAYCGGIGFVGLMIPHIVRAIVGVTSLRLLLGCFFLGGIFLMWVDVLAREVLSGQEIPIGIITSATGSLFFIALMVRSRRVSN